MWQDWCRCNVCALTAGSLSQWLQVLYELSFWRAVKALQMNKRVESAENDKDWLFQLMTCRKQRSEMAGNSLRNMLIAVPDACLWWLLIARPYQQVLFIPACTVCTFYPDYNCTISNAHTFSCLSARGDSSAWIHCRPKASTYSLHLLPSCLQRLIKTHSYTLWRYRSLTPRAHTGSVIKR